MRLLGKYAPAIVQLLRAYPHEKPAGLEENFYCSWYDLDGRPNYTLRHRSLCRLQTFRYCDRSSGATLQHLPGDRGLIPFPRNVVFYRSRVSTDQVAGLDRPSRRGSTRYHSQAADGDLQALAYSFEQN